MESASGFETLEMVNSTDEYDGNACDCNCDSGGGTGGECDPCDCNE